MENLLSLGTGHKNAITSVHVRFADDDPQRSPVEVLFAEWQPQPLRHNPTFMQMRFSLPRLSENLQTVVSFWFDSFASVRDVHNLYFDTLDTMHFEEPIFLNLSHVLEVYDRRRESNELVPRSEHRARVKALVAAVPASEQDWLRERLSYANEPRLSDRISRLVGRSDGALAKFIPDPTATARLVADTRNYFIHRSPHLAALAAQGIELTKLNYRLRALVEALLLNEAGFPWIDVGRMIDQQPDPDSIRSL
jgi:hypothetical protein